MRQLFKLSSKCKDHFFNISSLKPHFTNISFNVNNHNNSNNTQKHFELLALSQDVGVELASWIISPGTIGNASVLASSKMLLDKLALLWENNQFGRNTCSSLIELQPQSWRLASVSCWPVQTNCNVMINGKLIEQVQHAKLLGVTLDCHHGRNKKTAKYIPLVMD